MLNKLRNIFSNSIDFEPDQEYNLSDKQIAWVQYNQIQKSIDQINCDITDLNYDYNEVLKGINQADILQKAETKFLGKLKDLCELKNTKEQALEKAFVNIKGVIKNTDDFEYKKYLPQEGRLRSEMPQISAENIDDILIHFAQKSPNTKVTKKQMRLCDIKYIQTEFDDNKIIDILSQDNDFNNKYIISKDNYLIDANHRHASELEIDPVKDVTVLQINLPINELLRRCNLLKITKKESVQKSEVSDIELGKIQQDVLEKGGKKAQIGEIREWGGKKYQKTNDGWKPFNNPSVKQKGVQIQKIKKSKPINFDIDNKKEIVVRRIVNVDDISDIDFSALGNHWTRSFNYVHKNPFSSGKKYLAAIEAVFDKNDINTDATTYSNENHPKEHEVVIEPKSNPKKLVVTLSDENGNIKYIADRYVVNGSNTGLRFDKWVDEYVNKDMVREKERWVNENNLQNNEVVFLKGKDEDEEIIAIQQEVTEITKARSGVYADNPLNRKLNRVGQKYGSSGKPEIGDKKESKKVDDKKNSKVKGSLDERA